MNKGRVASLGSPAHLYSDNGTNFKGAEAKLSKGKISTTLSPRGIEWHFIPPYAPHFGGAWERLQVRSVKAALKAILKEQYVSEAVLRTALIEVEAVISLTIALMLMTILP